MRINPKQFYYPMVDFEDTFVIDGTLHEIKDVNFI